MVDVIIEACDKILQTEGSKALTATRLAEVAGITRGSMYQYFPNVESILTALYKEKIEKHLSRYSEPPIAESLGDGESLGDEQRSSSLRNMIEIMIEFHQNMLALNAPYYRKYIHCFDLVKWYNNISNEPNASIEFTKKVIGVDDGSDDDLIAFLIAHQLMSLGAAASEHPEYLNDSRFVETLLAMCEAAINNKPNT